MDHGVKGAMGNAVRGAMGSRSLMGSNVEGQWTIMLRRSSVDSYIMGKI